MSNSLQPHGLQHSRLPCPSLSPSNSWLLSQWCHPTISSSIAPFCSCPQSFPASGSFPVRSLHIRWSKYWSFSFNISPSNEYLGLISFRIDWLDLLAVQGTLKSLLQYHNSKASILWCSTFFMVQLSHPYLTTGKTIALTRLTFVGKVMSLLLNMLSRLVIMRESVPRQVDRESRGPQGERGLEFSRRKKGQAVFLSPHSLGLFNNNVSCLRTVFGFNLLLS